MDACPCGSGAAYTECCEPLILGHRPAETPEALMRSRYSAYALKKTDYVYDTTHPDQRQPDSRQVIQDWAATTEWHRLEILDRQGGGPDDSEGTVEFIAEYTEKGKRGTHHEIAEFQRLDGRWYFRDGRAPKIRQVVRSTPKVGRNDPCPCGSGKKYKKCCSA